MKKILLTDLKNECFQFLSHHHVAIDWIHCAWDSLTLNVYSFSIVSDFTSWYLKLDEAYQNFNWWKEKSSRDVTLFGWWSEKQSIIIQNERVQEENMQCIYETWSWWQTRGFVFCWGENSSERINAETVCFRLLWKRIPSSNLYTWSTIEALCSDGLTSPRRKNESNQLLRCAYKTAWSRHRWEEEEEKKEKIFFIDKFDAVWHTFFRSLRFHFLLHLMSSLHSVFDFENYICERFYNNHHRRGWKIEHLIFHCDELMRRSRKKYSLSHKNES